MKDFKEIKKEITEKYKKINNISDLLDKKAINQKEQYLVEFENDINLFLKKNIDNDIILKSEAKSDKKTEEEIKKDKIKKDFGKIKNELTKRIKSIFNGINIFLYKHCKNDLKKLLVDDLYEFFNIRLADYSSSEISDFVDNFVNIKYNEIFLNKENRRKTLLYVYLNRILKDVDSFFKINNKKRLEKMTILQKKNLIKFYLISIYNQFLKDDKQSGKIDRDDYEFLRERIRLFVLFKYDKILIEK